MPEIAVGAQIAEARCLDAQVTRIPEDIPRIIGGFVRIMGDI